MNGIDFSWARPGGFAITQAGNKFVFRYCPYPGDGGKGLTKDEIADYHIYGLGIGLVFESTASRHLQGYGAGVVDAQTAEAGRKSIGYPDNLPIYFAVDFDAQPNQMAAIDQYQAGAASVLGKNRVGIYGSYDVIEHCHLNDSAAYFWQTYAWSRGLEHPFYDYFQYENGVVLNGGEVDLCKGHGAALWQAKEEDELSQAQVDALQAQIDSIKRAVFAGSERHDEQGTVDPEEARTAYADSRIGQLDQSVNDKAESAIYFALKASGVIHDEMDEDEVRRVVVEALSGARITIGGKA